MTNLPVACTLDPAALRERRQGLVADLLHRAEHREEIPGGCRFRFTPADDLLSTLARVVDAERRCCQFLRFEIDVQPGGGPITLTLTGPEGTRELLSGLLRASPDPARPPA